ncbi:MAG TPA: hypothetical protein VIM11_17270 [Tepidisphaeraceae bacterium]|jgi:hypothetical protein
MIRRAIVFTPAIFGASLSLLAACQSHHEQPRSETPAPTSEAAPVTESTPAPATTSAETKPASRTWEAKGVRVTIPTGWQEKKDPDFELFLILPSPAQSDDAPRITFDVPDLPPHMSWMIQMARIQHDYEADLKKVHPDLKLDDASDVKIPNTTARLVRSTWHQNGLAHEDTALLMIHANGVYILDAQASEKQLTAVHAAFEAMRASLEWTK